MGLSLDYLVTQVVPEVMTENYLLVVANPNMREQALDFFEVLTAP